MDSSASKLLLRFKSHQSGLSQAEAEKLLSEFGSNTIKIKTHFNFLAMLAHQFTDLMVIILLIAGTMAFVFASYRDAGIMFLIVAVNAFIGFFQEFKIEKTLSALSNLLPKKVRVLRDNVEKEILSEFVVPGDVILISSGEDIPADAVIVESYGLNVDESTLTGESNPIDKHAIENTDQEVVDINFIYMGTAVVQGSAKAVVYQTGFKAKFGQIAAKTIKIKDDFSPLQKKLNQMSKLVARVAIIILSIVIIYGIFTGKDLVANFLFALALAAAVVPEGLPATVSVALSLAANRLAKKKALVKKLTSTESLGAATVICSDKTGTITEGKMEIASFWSLNQGEIDIEKLKVAELEICKNIFALCNHAEYVDDKIAGNYNEVTLLDYLVKKKIDFVKLRHSFPLIHEIPFSSERKMMSVVVKIENSYWVLTKGLPEKVVLKSKVSTKQSAEINRTENDFSGKSLHNIALAYKKLDHFTPTHNFSTQELQRINSELESDLSFLGIVGMNDPVKAGVKQAIQSCITAGIRVNMITGDSPKTALAVAKEIGLFHQKDDHLFTGDNLNKMSDLELQSLLKFNAVFAEVNPEHKLRIVENLQKIGEIVAVTGDGVNDAPALKKADIGVSMGHKGTDVAKEAADMILLDDNFTTIVRAIYEGRSIFRNIQKIIYYVFASNAGELLTVVLGVLLRLPLPIIAVQILAIDLGTDVLPSLALAADKGDGLLMKQKSEHKSAKLLNKKNLSKLLITGLIMGVGANVAFFVLSRAGYSYAVATTASYTTIVLCQIVSAGITHLNFQGHIFSKKLFNNHYLIGAELISALLLFMVIYFKPFQYLLQTAPLPLVAWTLPLLSAMVLFIFGQLSFMKRP